MGFNDIYRVEMITQVHGIFCRNTFSFRMKFPTGNSQKAVEHFVSDIMPIHKLIFSAFSNYVSVKATNVSQPLIDNYQQFIEGQFGGHPAEAIDPRIAAMWITRGDHAPGNNSTGANYFSGIPADWAQLSPHFAEAGQQAMGEFRDYLVQLYGSNGVSNVLEWGVFSKKNHAQQPEERLAWWFPIQKVTIRPFFASLRTRRPRGPF